MVKPDLMAGVCGEHGGDPASIRFFDRIGIDYVSHFDEYTCVCFIPDANTIVLT